ncbi:hypothetical protein [Candidatus Ichthyocystis hellenicum]|uniref:hypothetical protein n=1 Tax=Candidatus Ichthyocystis hellenicum TaxID=1561003 RepID=UPI000B85289F|nr:hypothetical protein [Candidatus Ichthyocystis hellenicum]
MAPLIFLYTLECATGSEVSEGWISLKSSLCGLMYIEKCFNAAMSKGEDVPNVNITNVLSTILGDAAAIMDLVSNETTTPPGYFENVDRNAYPLEMDMDRELSILTFFYISDNINAACRSLIFNLTDPSLKQLTQTQRDNKGLLYFLNSVFFKSDPVVRFNMDYSLYLLDQVGIPRDDVLDCAYTDHAVRSNVSGNVLKRILNSTKIDTLKSYCSNIGEYIPVDKDALDPKEIFAPKMTTSTIKPSSTLEPTSTIETTSNDELNVVTVVAAVLTIMGVVLFVFYAVSNLVKRKSSSFSKKNTTYGSIGKSSSNIPYRRLGKVTAEEV